MWKNKLSFYTFVISSIVVFSKISYVSRFFHQYFVGASFVCVKVGERKYAGCGGRAVYYFTNFFISNFLLLLSKINTMVYKKINVPGFPMNIDIGG